MYLTYYCMLMIFFLYSDKIKELFNLGKKKHVQYSFLNIFLKQYKLFFKGENIISIFSLMFAAIVQKHSFWTLMLTLNYHIYLVYLLY